MAEQLPIIVAQVNKVTSDIPDGKIFVDGPGISPDTPVYYAGPPQFFSMPGKGDYVIVICAYIKKNQKSYYWTSQVALPQLMGMERETNPQGFQETTKSPEVIEGQDGNAQGQALNVFGQVPPDGYAKEHGVPSVVQLRDKKGARLRFNSKGSEGAGNYVELKSAKGKKLLIEDNPPTFTNGPTPRTFPGKISGEKDKIIPSKNRILLTDRNNNRVQIDEHLDSVEMHAKNAAKVTTDGGRIDIGIKGTKNGGGLVDINNATLAGQVRLESGRGTVSTFGQAGFDMFASMTPAAPMGAGIVANTADVISTPLSRNLIPNPNPELFLGCGVTLDPISNKPLTAGALTYQTFTPLGTQIESLLGFFNTKALTVSHEGIASYEIFSPLTTIQGGSLAVKSITTFSAPVTLSSPVTFGGTTAFNGAQTFTGANTFNGTITGTAAVALTGIPTVPVADLNPLGIPLKIHTAPGVTYNGMAMLVFSP